MLQLALPATPSQSFHGSRAPRALCGDQAGWDKACALPTRLRNARCDAERGPRFARWRETRLQQCGRSLVGERRGSPFVRWRETWQLVRSLARDLAATVWPFACWRETWQVSGQGGELQATWLTGSLARAATDKSTFFDGSEQSVGLGGSRGSAGCVQHGRRIRQLPLPRGPGRVEPSMDPVTGTVLAHNWGEQAWLRAPGKRPGRRHAN